MTFAQRSCKMHHGKVNIPLALEPHCLPPNPPSFSLSLSSSISVYVFNPFLDRSESCHLVLLPLPQFPVAQSSFNHSGSTNHHTKGHGAL